MNTENLVQSPPADRFPKADLVIPTSSGYVVIAAEVDRRFNLGYFLESERKKSLLAILVQKIDALDVTMLVRPPTLFKAILIPPGRGEYLTLRPDAHVARYDVLVRIETTSLDAAEKLTGTSGYQSLLRALADSSQVVYTTVGQNARRMGPVDQVSDGVFLFNYFLADNLQQNLTIWENTAGWFQSETHLKNSEVMVPVSQTGANFTMINHCRWDRLRDVLPPLMFKRSFRSYVLDAFEANSIAAMPVLYKLA